MKKPLNVSLIVVSVCLVTGLLAPMSLARARGLEDLNLTERIVLVLANSLSPDYQSGPDDMPELMQMVEDGDIFVDEEEEEAGQGKGMYAYSYPMKIGDFRGSGYFRIASQARYRKPEEEEGWRSLAEDGGSGAKVWFRTIRTGAVSYNEVQASLSKGNFVLTTSMRRPAGESASQARGIILEQFNVLLENAKRYGILSNIVIEFAKEEKAERLGYNDLLNILCRQSGATAVPFKVYAEDYKRNRLPNVDFYTIKVEGFLARHAKFEGASYNKEKERYEIHNAPVEGAQVVLILPPLRDGGFANDLEQNELLSSDYGITLEVDAVFKPEKTPPPA